MKDGDEGWSKVLERKMNVLEDNENGTNAESVNQVNVNYEEGSVRENKQYLEGLLKKRERGKEQSD